MSEERNDGIRDSGVSDAYRDAATERAPASLNEAVLRNAAAHASKGYAHSMLWMRPLAWAATVVLSLAIVVQVVLPPGPATEQQALIPPAGPDAADAALDTEAAADGALEPPAADGPPKVLRDQETREDTKIEEIPMPAAPPEPAAPAREAGTATTGERLDADAAAALEEPEVRSFATAPGEADSLETAAERSASGIRQVTVTAATPEARPENLARLRSAEDSVCEPEDLESPATWAACIERLEDAGRSEEALAERLLLAEAFPDFEWPSE